MVSLTTEQSLAVLATLPKCAMDCMMGAPSTGQGSTDVDLCAPQPLETTNWVMGCMKSNCSTPEALFTQNATLRACGVEPRMERQWLPVMTTFMILAFISVVLRVANRLYTTKTYWWDDIFLSLSMAGSFAYASIHYEAMGHGFGREFWSLSPEEINYIIAGVYASMLVFHAARMLLRHSQILFFLRIFVVGNSKPMIKGTMIANAVLSTAIGLIMALQCMPVSFFWMRWDSTQEGKCLNNLQTLWITSVFTMLLDAWTLILPLPYVAKLQLSVRKRIGISVMLATGLSILIFSILKFWSGAITVEEPNPMYTFAQVSMWASLEINVGIICACLPGIRLLFSNLFRQTGWFMTSSIRRTEHISLSGSPDRSGKKSCPESQIRITTTIQTKATHALTDSESHLPLHAASLGAAIHPARQELGVVANAWA
ncbi:uncharacterized protein QC763_207630 [Podospora pseudopauciseta]|uniref:Extracellular membrane protein CFEM domain-containing protein n=1 Tax=Podospora pseudopauciseta TaxID=2093780 RepID=A0ABR0HPG3_9PEZI|nr:hypothetical protein QC763_207630 [Podospora pseudopauciseta]